MRWRSSGGSIATIREAETERKGKGKRGWLRKKIKKVADADEVMKVIIMNAKGLTTESGIDVNGVKKE